MRKFTDFVLEEVPTNSAGVGAVDGIGVGPRGEPGGRRNSMFLSRLKRIKKAKGETECSK